MAEVTGIRSGSPPDRTPKVSRQLPARPDFKFQTGTKLARFLPIFSCCYGGQGIGASVPHPPGQTGPGLASLSSGAVGPLCH